MSIKKTTIYTITPKTTGGCNEMQLIYTDGEQAIGCKYSLHHWQSSPEGLANELDLMAKALRAFRPDGASEKDISRRTENE